jgi:hypothetical protein
MHKTKAGEKRKTLHRKALELARDAKRFCRWPLKRPCKKPARRLKG